MKFRSHILLFSLAIFILTSVGLFVVYARNKVLLFWSVFSYIIAGSLVFAFALHFLIGKSKLSVKKVLLLTFAVIVVAATTTHSVWTIITPRWSFSLSTDNLHMLSVKMFELQLLSKIVALSPTHSSHRSENHLRL